MDIYETYAVLTAEEKDIAAKKEVVRNLILQDMDAKGLQKEVKPLGQFSITKLKKWTFPKYVTDLEDKFKTAKEKSKSTEEATYIEEDSLRFTPLSI